MSSVRVTDPGISIAEMQMREKHAKELEDAAKKRQEEYEATGQITQEQVEEVKTLNEAAAAARKLAEDAKKFREKYMADYGLDDETGGGKKRKSRKARKSLKGRKTRKGRKSRKSRGSRKYRK